MFEHRKGVIGVVITVTCIVLAITTLVLFTTAYVSLTDIMLRIMFDEEDKSDGNDDLSFGNYPLGDMVFFDIWHRKCEELDWDKINHIVVKDVSSGGTAWGNDALATVKLYSLICEILTRDEINPGIVSDPMGDGTRHTEVKTGVITPEFILGKIASESGFQIDIKLSYGGAIYGYDALYKGGHRVTDPINDGWFTQQYVHAIPYSFIDIASPSAVMEDLGFLLMPSVYNDAMYKDYGSRYGYFIDKFYDMSLSDIAERYLHGPEGVEATGPVGQDLSYSYNWRTSGNVPASIFISKQENPDLDDDKRAIYGYRNTFYKITEADNEYLSQHYTVNGAPATYENLLALMSAKEKVDKSGTAYYLTGEVWSSRLGDMLPATYTDIATSIRQGNLDLNSPIGYMSRPAIYYYPDALYTLSLQMRSTLEGCDYGYYIASSGVAISNNAGYKGLSGVSSFTDKNDRLLYYAASTQAGTAYYKAGGSVDNWLEDKSDFTREMLYNAAPKELLSVYLNGVNNIHNGEIELEKFHSIIDQLYSNKEFLRDDVIDSGFDDYDWEEDPGNFGTSSGSYSNQIDFLWPVDTKFNAVSSIFAEADYAGAGTYHGGIDIYASAVGTGINGTSVHPIAPGIVIKANKTDAYGGGWGYYVMVDHGGNYYSLYAHMQQNSLTVSVGDYVKSDTVIGKVGSTGNSSGPHLHLEVYLNGKSSYTDRVDPFHFKFADMSFNSLWSAYSTPQAFFDKYEAEKTYPPCTQLKVEGSKRYTVLLTTVPELTQDIINSKYEEWKKSHVGGGGGQHR